MTLALLALLGLAHAADYRRVTLDDGRTYVAEMAGREEGRMVLLTPQGKVRIDPASIQSLDVIEAAELKSQRPWRALVLPIGAPNPSAQGMAGELMRNLPARLDAIPAVDPLASDVMAVCLDNMDCAEQIGRASGADLVVSGTLQGSPEAWELQLVLVPTMAPRAAQRRSISGRGPIPEGLLTEALYGGLYLEPPPAAPVAVVPVPQPVDPQLPPPQERPPAETLRKMALVPLPGLPSMLAGDGRGAALAWLVAAPGTAGMVAAAGASSASPGRMIATSALGSWVLISATNRALLDRQLAVGLAAGPSGEPELRAAARW